MSGLSRNLAALAVFVFSITLHAAPLGTGFTYQGKLVQNGVDVTELCDFNFGLWDAAGGGSQVATAINTPNVQVTGGTFTVELDYGAGVFDGQARWLEIAVACPTGGGLTTLAPRQELTPAPNALFAAEAGAMEWTGLQNIPPDIADGDDVDDDDADASNELQDLSLAGNSLSLTDDATPVDLSGYLDNTDDQTLAEVLIEGNDAGGTTITNLPAPVADSDASTKAYVDSQGGAQNLTDVLMQGNDAGGIAITNLPAPVADSDASTKAYVDSQGGAQDLTDVLTQGNDAGGITITNLPAPVAGSDAATMAYVDAHEDSDADPTNELQDLSLGGNTLSLTDDASPVDLSSYLDNTDDQTLDLTADQLSIESGNSVDLSGYLDDTDDQTLAEVLTEGNDAGGMTITNLPVPVADSDASTKAYVDAQAGGSQTLVEVLTEGNDAGGITITNLPAPVAGSDAATRTYVDGHVDADFDPTNELQDLDLSGNSLSLTGDASPVNLSGFLDNTDDQMLDLTADQLSIENGNSVDLSGYLDDTDDQTLAEVLTEGNDAGGASISNIGTTTTTALTISGLDCTGNANGGALTTNASGVVSCSDDNGGAGMGNTLDEAYDQGGPGAGRSITADSGAVNIEGADGLVLDEANLLQTPADPVVVSSLNLGFGSPRSVSVSGGYAYVVDESLSDLKIIDISDPSAPFIAGSVNIGGGPVSVYVSGRYAYVAKIVPSGLAVIDVSDPAAPSVVGSLAEGTGFQSIYISGSHAYAVDTFTGLKVINVSDPTAPSLSGSLNVGSSPTSIYVSGRFAFVTFSGSEELKVIDVSDPGTPFEVGSVGISGAPTSVYVSGRYAYVTEGSAGAFKVFDVANPSLPNEVGSLNIGQFPRSVKVSGRYAYLVLEGTGDIKMIDVSDPATPLPVGGSNIGVTPQSVYISGRYAFAVDNNFGDFVVIDLSGAEFSAAVAHSLEAGNLQVRNDIIAQGQLQVSGGANIGAGGLFSDGDVGVAGNVTATSGNVALLGNAVNTDGIGVFGVAPDGEGVRGEAANGTGVYGLSEGMFNGATGVKGESTGPSGWGVWGVANSHVGTPRGVYGLTTSPEGIGVFGAAGSGVSLLPGVFGITQSFAGSDTSSGSAYVDSRVVGVHGRASSVVSTSEIRHGVLGDTWSTTGAGVYASNRSSNSGAAPDLILGISSTSDTGDNGIIASDPFDPNSDLFIHAMDTVIIRLNQDGTDDLQSTDSEFLITYTDATATVNAIFKVETNGDVFADGGYHCGNSINDAAGTLDEVEIAPCLVDDAPADFAEMLPAVGESQPGDVLVTAPDGTLIQSWSAYSGNVVGVYSTRPSYLGNARKLDADDHVPLAVSGIVPVRASAENGPIRAGDLLTSAAVPGHAMRCEGFERCFGRVIGKALEPLPADTGMIRILVSLN